jgi:hypothetical protein
VGCATPGTQRPVRVIGTESLKAPNVEVHVCHMTVDGRSQRTYRPPYLQSVWLHREPKDAGQLVQAMEDNGSDISFITPDVVKALGVKPSPSNVIVVTANGGKEPSRGSIARSDGRASVWADLDILQTYPIRCHLSGLDRGLRLRRPANLPAHVPKKMSRWRMTMVL